MKANNKYQLLTIELPDPRDVGSEVAPTSKFLATAYDIDLLRALDGATIYLDDLHGKDNEAYAVLDINNIMIESISPQDAQALLDDKGKFIEGPNIFKNIDLPELFHNLSGSEMVGMVIESLSREQFDQLNELMETSENMKDFDPVYDEEYNQYSAYDYYYLITYHMNPLLAKSWEIKLTKLFEKTEHYQDVIDEQFPIFKQELIDDLFG